MTDQAIQKVPHERELYLALTKVSSQIKAVMPKGWDDGDYKRLLSCAAIQSRKWGRNEQDRQEILKNLDMGSFIEAVTTAASCQIVPDGRRGYLITRRSRSANFGHGGYTVTFQADYKGLMDCAKRSDPRILNIHADTIHEGDIFVHEEGSERTFTHSIPRECLCNGRGELQGAYAVAYYVNGHYDLEVLSLYDLKKIMSCSSAEYGPNKDWPLQMHRKAAIRRLCKRLPESPDLARLLDTENAIYDVSSAPESPRRARGVIDMGESELPPVSMPEPEEAQEAAEEVQQAQFVEEPKAKKAKKKAPAKKKPSAAAGAEKARKKAEDEEDRLIALGVITAHYKTADVLELDLPQGLQKSSEELAEEATSSLQNFAVELGDYIDANQLPFNN